MATWDEIRGAALALPDVVEVSPRQWRVRAGLLAWERPLRRSDLDALGDAAPTGDILGVRTVDVASKDELLAAMPDVFFTTPHFDGYPAVLARLPELEPSLFAHLLREVWLVRAPRRAVKAFLATQGGSG